MASAPDAQLDDVAVPARLAAIEERLDEIIRRLDNMKNLVAMLGRAQIDRQLANEG